MRRILHLSDLHFGRTNLRVTEALRSEARALSPDIVVVSGDLTQRARPRQFAEARDFLNSLAAPRIIVPGNHDIPLYHVLERFISPLRRYRRMVEPDLEPFYLDEEVAILGVSTVRRFRATEGSLRREQIDRIVERFSSVPASVLRVLVKHHPPHEMNPRELFRHGLDLILTGHHHMTRAEPSSRFFSFDHRSALLVAAGTATSTRLRGETNAFNLIVLDGARGEARVMTHGWERTGFRALGEHRYQLRETGWSRSLSG